MDVEEYRARRRRREAAAPRTRALCRACLLAATRCFCDRVTRFDPGFTVAILTHPIEMAGRIATGRMAHLALEGSVHLRGARFGDDPAVNRLVRDPGNRCYVLFPGDDAVNLDILGAPQRRDLTGAPGRLVVFVIDGTWQTARKTLRTSPNLARLPRLAFEPREASRFAARQQPQGHCLSTAEAIREVVHLLGDAAARAGADALLDLQAARVEEELAYRRGERRGSQSAYRPTNRPARDPLP